MATTAAAGGALALLPCPHGAVWCGPLPCSPTLRTGRSSTSSGSDCATPSGAPAPPLRAAGMGCGPLLRRARAAASAQAAAPANALPLQDGWAARGGEWLGLEPR